MSRWCRTSDTSAINRMTLQRNDSRVPWCCFPKMNLFRDFKTGARKMMIWWCFLFCPKTTVIEFSWELMKHKNNINAVHVSLFLNYFIYIHIPAGSFPRVLLSVYKLTVGRHPAVFSLRWCRSHVNWKPPDVFHGKPSDGQIFTLETRACEPWKWFARLTPDFILNKVQGSKHFGSLPWKWSEKSCLKNKCSCSWASLKHMFVVEMQDVWEETSCAKTACLLEGYQSHYGKGRCGCLFPNGKRYLRCGLGYCDIENDQMKLVKTLRSTT